MAMKSGMLAPLVMIFMLFTLKAKCQQPCCTMEVDMTNKFTTMTPNMSSLEIRFPPTVKEYVEIEIYALFNLLAGKKGKHCLKCYSPGSSEVIVCFLRSILLLLYS